MSIFWERYFPDNIIRTNRDDECEKYLIASIIVCDVGNMILY